MISAPQKQPIAPSPSPEQTPAPSPREGPARLESVDALRGFNMFWIIGGADLLAAIAGAAHWGWLNAVSANLTEHVDWEGFHFHDMIFPLFLFIMGVTTPFSLARRREQGTGAKRRQGRAALVRHVLQRTALLFLLGLVYNGVLKLPGIEHVRIMGVLQRLALASGSAALLFLFLELRGQIAAAVSLLVAYWIVMRWIPVPGHPPGSFTPDGNFANYLDRALFLPGQLYERYGDPEGLLSTIPAVATALLGLFAGQWLRAPRTPREKVAGLLAAGALGIAAGYAWSPWFPVIKKLWTSSYVLVAGGWSAVLLALFYEVIEVRGWKRWAYFFTVIGLNPITIYLGQRIIDFKKIALFFAGGALQFTGIMTPILLGIGILAVKWLFLRFLHRQRIYLRV
jgi:predicted acyltransferase